MQENLIHVLSTTAPDGSRRCMRCLSLIPYAPLEKNIPAGIYYHLQEFGDCTAQSLTEMPSGTVLCDPHPDTLPASNAAKGWRLGLGWLFVVGGCVALWTFGYYVAVGNHDRAGLSLLATVLLCLALFLIR